VHILPQEGQANLVLSEVLTVGTTIGVDMCGDARSVVIAEAHSGALSPVDGLWREGPHVSGAL
jgi:hypothetical protein